jgi:hypothetical protein
VSIGTKPDDAAGDGEEDALDERLGDNLAPRRADRQPQRGLAAARDRARQQQVGDVGTRKEEDQPAHAEKNLQAAAVLFLHHADAGPRGHNRDDLPRQALDDLRHPVRRIARVVLHPLVQDPGESWADAVCRRTWTKPANHAQPRRHGLAEDGRVTVDHRLLLERNPHIRRITA